MTTYRRYQWVSSFEGQMSILRPHLTGRMLGAISAAAWQQYGMKGVDPIQAAGAVDRPRWRAATSLGDL